MQVELENIQILNLRPGDILVYTTEFMLDREQINAIQEQLHTLMKKLPSDVGVHVITCGKLSVLRKEEASAVP
jgi:hypothetical protein